MRGRHRIATALAALAAALSVATAAVYGSVMRAQGDTPSSWVLAVLAGAVVLSLYGALVGVPARRAALFFGGAVLIVLGVLAIFSIGAPLVLGGLLLVAAGALVPRSELGQPR